MARTQKSSAKSRAPAAPPRAIALASDTRQTLLWGAAIVLLVFLAYWPALGNGFIWDDDFHVQANDTLRSIDGLRRIWVEPRSIPQYYPLVHTTFWIEYHLWNLSATGYHVVNVLLHAATAILFWRLLVRLAVPGAWLAAAIFAVHPVEVESVAWITERKNVLSAALALASMLAYLRFNPAEAVERRPADDVPREWGWYTLALALFVAAILAKTVTVAVPALLMVIYWWKRGVVSPRDVGPFAPFVALGLGMALITVTLEKNHVGAVGQAWNLGPVERVLVAGRALWFYAGKVLWPSDLNFFYPRWSIDRGVAWQYTFPLAAIAVIIVLWWARKRIGRGPLAAVLIFIGVLSPALGFFDVYPFRYSYVADHFQYHASMALIALAAAGATLLWQHITEAPRMMATVAASAVLAVLASMTWQRTHIYRDQFTLFSDVVARDSESWIGHTNLGALYLQQENFAKALDHLSVSVELKPGDLESENNMALALAGLGENRKAIARLEEAVKIVDAPQAHMAYTANNLAWLLATCEDAALRDPARALEIASRAVRLDSTKAAYYGTLGIAAYRTGDWSTALLDCQQAINMNQGGSTERFVIAMTNWQLGRKDEARKWFNEAVQWRLEHEAADAEARRLEEEAADLMAADDAKPAESP